MVLKGLRQFSLELTRDPDVKGRKPAHIGVAYQKHIWAFFKISFELLRGLSGALDAGGKKTHLNRSSVSKAFWHFFIQDAPARTLGNHSAVEGGKPLR